MSDKKEKVVVVVSGGFDPIHIGHVRLFQNARNLGTELVVILNNDNWLRKKKNHVFMPEDERKEIIEALKGVDRVVLTKHEPDPRDMSVCAELREIKPNIFAQGGDRSKEDAENPNSSQNPEAILCKELGIEIVHNVGHGGKVQSSSWLLGKYLEAKSNSGTKKNEIREA